MTYPRCYILCAGPAEGEIPLPAPGDFIICCDGGLAVAQRLSITPDLIVTDHDSYTGPMPAGIPVLELPVEKDDTDSMKAIRVGFERGFKDFLLVCALGGRLDHTVGNLQALGYILDQGGRGEAVGCGDRAMIVENGRMAFQGRPGQYVSAFAVDGEARGVTTEGLHYPLHDATLTGSFPLGVSNKLEGTEAAYRVREGRLLVILPGEE